MKISTSLMSCVCTQPLQLCLTFWNPMDCSLPDSSVHGILQARILEWVVMPSSRGSSPPRDGTWVSCMTDWFFTAEPLGKPLRVLRDHFSLEWMVRKTHLGTAERKTCSVLALGENWEIWGKPKGFMNKNKSPVLSQISHHSRQHLSPKA